MRIPPCFKTFILLLKSFCPNFLAINTTVKLTDNQCPSVISGVPKRVEAFDQQEDKNLTLDS